MAWIAALILGLNTSQTTSWQAADFTIEVDTTAETLVIKASDGTEVVRRTNALYDYALSKPNSLTITGTQNSIRFTTTYSIHQNTIHATTTILPPRSATLLKVTDQYQTSTQWEQIGAKYASQWSSPICQSVSDTQQVVIAPDPAMFPLHNPMMGYLDLGEIGYMNAALNESGSPVELTKPRPITTQFSYSYFISITQKDAPTITSTLWSRASARHRTQAFPQLAPFIITANATLGFKGLSYSSGTVPNQEPTIGDRWWSKGDFGGPTGQLDTVQFGTQSNAMRVALSMVDLGVFQKMPAWQTKGTELINLLIAGSPETGFAESVIAPDGNPDDPEPSPKSASDAEITTALYALQFIARFPDHSARPALESRILGVFRRLDRNNVAPIAALVACASTLKGVPDSIRQAAVELQVQIITVYTADPAPTVTPITLEALYWLDTLSPNVFRESLISQTKAALANQNLFDQRDHDLLPIFGSFRSATSLVDPQTGAFASIIGRIALRIQNNEWLDRAAFALRSQHAFFNSLGEYAEPIAIKGLGFGTASAGFGNIFPELPDPRISFESAEGLLLATHWELLRETGGAIINDQGEVGIDAMTTLQTGRLVNTLFSNPAPFAKAFHLPIKTNGDPLDPAGLPGVPHIIRFDYQLRENQPYIVANPGLSLSYRSETPTATFKIDGKTIPAQLGETGFETKLASNQLNRPISIMGKIGNQEFNREISVPNLAPVSWGVKFLSTWNRTNWLRWIGSPTQMNGAHPWISTADRGDGTDALHYTGEIISPKLTGEGSKLEFTARGSGNCQIQIIDPAEGTIYESWRPRGRTETISLDLSSLNGQPIQIIISDNDEKGMIAVSNLVVKN
jgi:hypothetical protein